MPTRAATTGVGGIDWLAHWRQMYDAEQAQTLAIAAPDSTTDTDRWAGQPQRSVAAIGRVTQPDAFLRLVLPHLRPSDTVLDIGAGAGRHTLFLAQHVKQVIAVEQSPTMLRQLERGIAEHHHANIAVIPVTWPAAAVPQADVSICSHVVYGVREIAPFLHAMDTQTRRGCFLAVGFRQPSYGMRPFWERIHGAPRLALPGALECLNVCYQLGIPAHLTCLPASQYTFADEAEALADIRWRIRLTQTPATDVAIRAAMADLLERTSAGQLVLPNQPTHTAVLWWSHAS